MLSNNSGSLNLLLNMTLLLNWRFVFASSVWWSHSDGGGLKRKREAGPRCSALNWIKGQRLLRLPPAGWLPETLDQCLHHLTTCESDSFIQSSPTHLRDLNNTSEHNESNAVPGKKNKPPHKHTHARACAHVTLMIVSEDKRKFADKFMTYSKREREMAVALADGCTAVTFWRNVSFDI